MTAQLLMTQTEIDADRGEWHRHRRTGITASEIAAIMGIAPPEHGSAWKVFAAKQTGESYDADTDATLRGTHLEGYVADRLQAESPGVQLQPGGLYANSERPWQLATFDRLGLYESDHLVAWRPVQIKTSASYDGWGDAGTDQIPVHYKAQVLWEIDVHGADEALVPCLFVHSWQLRVYKVVLDADAEADLAYMRQEAVEFRDRLRRDDPPPVDWTPATTRALKTVYNAEPDGTAVIPVKLARKYRQARQRAAAADRELKQATNEILARVADAKYIVTSHRARNAEDRRVLVATRTRHPMHTLDAKIIRASYPDAAKAAERVTAVSTLRAATWAKTGQ